MSAKDLIKQKLEALDQKIKARLAVHEMEPELKKKWEIREDFRRVGRNIDDRIEMIERMKAKVDEMEAGK